MRQLSPLCVRFLIRALLLDRDSRDVGSRLDEPHISSRSATAHSAYGHLGLTDAALLTIAKTLAIPVLTDDVLCYQALLSEGIVAANFTHFRRAQLGIE